VFAVIPKVLLSFWWISKCLVLGQRLLPQALRSFLFLFNFDINNGLLETHLMWFMNTFALLDFFFFLSSSSSASSLSSLSFSLPLWRFSSQMLISRRVNRIRHHVSHCRASCRPILARINRFLCLRLARS
jgi:hypothetical protein